MGRQLILASSCQAADAAVLRIIREIVFFSQKNWNAAAVTELIS